MNPGLVVKLRPTGPWRIGPDSGARNKVDSVYHSDSLYGAVTSAMARLGRLEEWLDATARSAAPAVRFSSCFPFVDEIGFVAPPRTAWPPTSPGMLSARVRWKSARFVPLGIVPAIVAGERLDDSKWAVDGPSECLVPAGRSGPFRTGVRWNAAVDRLSGVSERHSTACLEFRPGAGLWTVVSFADDAARDRWSDPIKAAFRWLADSGFGGERSRGWGRSDAPEFVEGTLPEMIFEAGKSAPSMPPAEPEPPVEEPSPVPPIEPPAEEPPAPPVEEPPAEEPPATEPPVEEPPVVEPPASEPEPEPLEEASQREKPDIAGFSAASDDETPEPEPESTPEPEQAAEPESPASEPEQVATPEPTSQPEQAAAPESPGPEPEQPAPAEAPPPTLRPPAPISGSPYWLLSLFTPSPEDTIDWAHGNYALLNRGGRVDASGELKKQVAMVAEGSVVYSAAPPHGSAPDVAPEGCAHPVYRAGFAVAIPLGEVK